ncbi:MAG: hypothetical protein ACE5LB_15365 [Acidiferrobacterales bacterium]
MRKAPAILSAMLIVSLVANAVLWYRAESARNDATFNAGVAEVVGMFWGESEAERDYESGLLRWYRFDNAGGLPKDKSDRQIVTVDLALEPPYLHRSTRAFVASYNRTIDKLIAKKDAPPPRKKWKR